ncbi:GNAT family N-acetyltransferase [Rubrivivax benzoatilyticus]|uniref:GNAT family N-acetyltransferase n=1 Tax=Rubrivivax benzoatilyticus TaxID=316997 RepID=A0ABX0HWB7_9BURK|nr:GNAT family protein [Rubrivivax benzoatilyticus]NHK98112.1 GNAT family N-acetyltransferase [Rubrivivax benzoatilyticus]NHL23614.1 GNAT family N-acetyltransferase [Rubrivivax benzoatilyticus]
MSFSVRRATEEDAAALLDLRRAVFTETDFMLWEPQEFKATEEDERKFIAWLSGKTNNVLLVAKEGADLVGFLGASGGERIRTRHSALIFLGVRREYWSRGVASAMLHEALSWASTAGMLRLELNVHTTNDRAVALYKRFGFQIEGKRRASMLVAGQVRDEYLMSYVADPKFTVLHDA